MPVISAKVIKKSRKVRFCGQYRHEGKTLIPEGESHIRLYGNAFTGDPPYVMYICLKCASESEDPKIIAALEIM